MTDGRPDPRTESAVEPVPRHDGTPPVRWLLFIGGPILFGVHFLVVYLTTEAACAVAPPADRLATSVTVVATGVAVLVGAAITWASYRWWREMEPQRDEGGRIRAARRRGVGPSAETEVPEGPDGSADPGPLRDSSLALTSTMLCALFTVSVLVVGLPALVLPAC